MEKGARKKILIVDNNERVLMILQGVLENVGFDTVTTWSGAEALDFLKAREFDVLLVDDYLPDLHAGSFLAEVSRLPVQPWVVVMQAAAPTAADRRYYERLGVLSVVRKHHIAEVCNAVCCCSVKEPLARAAVN